MTAPRVTIAGGGIAGLTAALRLAERGYAVKLYERAAVLGGNLASRPAEDGVNLDVYPHMYLNWYHNLWRLLEDVGVERAESFRPLDGVQQLRRGQYPRFSTLNEPFSIWYLLQNLFSGVGPPADMLLVGYANVDLLAERLNPTLLLDDVSVNGFLHARPYMTERAAAAYDSFITRVWAIPSYLAAADDYRDYLEYSIATPTPSFWLPRGSALDRVIGPLTDALEAAGVEIVRSTEVTSVACEAGRVRDIGLGDGFREAVDELVLAVPAHVLLRLVRTGAPGERIVEAAPRLSEVGRLRAEPVPLLNLFFTRRLPYIPVEPVGLFRSRYGLAFTDISQTWKAFGDRTVLALSASDPYALPGTGATEDTAAMLAELGAYLDFTDADIDWERTRYQSNEDTLLTVNETGADVWRPGASCPGLANLSFAGDYCDNRIGMTTIESAVVTGLEAARAIVARRGGAAVAIREPRALPRSMWVGLRYAWAPYAAAASVWSKGRDGLLALLRARQR